MDFSEGIGILNPSVFQKVPSQEVKLHYGDDTALNIRIRGFEDFVIWNPTESIGKNIGDMEQGGWVSWNYSPSCDIDNRTDISVSSLDTSTSSRLSRREKSFWVNRSCVLSEPGIYWTRGRVDCERRSRSYACNIGTWCIPTCLHHQLAS